MKIIPFIYNDIEELKSNTYLLIDKENNCIVIDPSSTNEKIGDYIINNNLHLKAILLTHGHIDHIRGINTLIKRFGVNYYLHFEEEEFPSNNYLNCAQFLNEEFSTSFKGKTLIDKEVISLLEEDIEVIHTPYHTQGSVCYYLKESNLLFTGDSLFKGGVGRSDLPTGNSRQMSSSLKSIFSLNENVKVYPGHGNPTSIKNEKSEIYL